jgi:hypothetical protein
LCAARVELGIVFEGIVECKNLRADKVSATCETLGQVDVQETLVVDDLVSAPSIGILLVPVVKDLEPAIAGTLILNGGRNLLGVYRAGTLVAAVKGLLAWVVRPGVDLEAEKSAIRN